MRLSGAVLATAALAAPVLGQRLDIRAPSAPRATTGAAPAAAPAAAAAPPPAPEWSESGASNHPLMTAQAIRAAAANFRSCLEGSTQAERRGSAARCSTPMSQG